MCRDKTVRRLRTLRATALIGGLVATSLVGGCATEVIDTATTTMAPSESTLAPESLAGEDLETLVGVLRDETEALAKATFDGEKTAARAHLARINEAWANAEPLIFAQFGELADQITYDLRRVIELARSSVERNRPADASKALNFLRLAIASLAVQGS